MKGTINQKQWKEILSTDLPGEQAQMLMAPEFRGEFVQTDDALRAAVLVLMYPFQERTYLVFMKRNAYDGPHSAQVSFPGGAWEKKDKTLEITALRETKEEMGITNEITLLGSLTELYIPVSNFRVTPFVGWTDRKPQFDPDPSEVQYVIESTLDELMDPENRTSEIIYRHGQSIMTPYFHIRNEKIWGATAMILSEFLQLAARLP
jgi:8-oxo-dGTP pyrophosphatase MutT (NUDIX family)